jgi:hypothetical protein
MRQTEKKNTFFEHAFFDAYIFCILDLFLASEHAIEHSKKYSFSRCVSTKDAQQVVAGFLLRSLD